MLTTWGASLGSREPMSDETIRLTLPADPEYGRVARTALAALALRLGFAYSQIEELRLAIDEPLILLLRPEDGERPEGGKGVVTLDFEPTETGIKIEARSTAGAGQARGDTDSRARFEGLVAPVVDEWEVDDHATCVHLVKERTD